MEQEIKYRLITTKYDKNGEIIYTRVGRINKDKDYLICLAEELIDDDMMKVCEIVIVDVVIGKW